MKFRSIAAGLRRALVLVAVLAVAACSRGEDEPAAADAASAAGEEPVLNLYSSRHYQTDERLYSDFTEQTGIRINRIEGKGDALIQRIQSEGENSPADLLITVDAGRLWRADEAGLFQPTASPALDEAIPANLRHPDNHWFGFSTRARIIFYNRERIQPGELKDYEDLADPRWAGEVCIRSSSNIYNLSLMASLISHADVASAEDWARGVVANFAREPQGGDTDQLRAVAAGECGIALANTYYYARLMRSEDPRDKEVVDKVGWIFPNQSNRGTHVNISGAGVLARAPHPGNARLFLEYLVSEQAQRWFADGNNEFPVTGVDTGNPAIETLGEFKVDEINVAQYGIHQSEAQQAYDRAGWP